MNTLLLDVGNMLLATWAAIYVMAVGGVATTFSYNDRRDLFFMGAVLFSSIRYLFLEINWLLK